MVCTHEYVRNGQMNGRICEPRGEGGKEKSVKDSQPIDDVWRGPGNKVCNPVRLAVWSHKVFQSMLDVAARFAVP